MIAVLGLFLLAAPDLLEQASKAREQGRLDQAIELYRQAAKANPKSGEAWWYLGMCLYEKQRCAEAEPAFATLTTLHPDRGAGWAMRGLCQYRTGQYPQALESLTRAQALGLPQMEDLANVARYHLIVLLNHAGKHEVATGLLMSFVAANAVTPLITKAAGQAALRIRSIPSELPPDGEEPVRLAGQAAVLAWQKQLPEAKKVATDLLVRFPAQPNARYLMGYLLLLENDPASIDWFEKELTVSPAHIQARLQIAYELLRRGDAAKGLPYAQKAAQLGPGEFLARDIYGRILLDLERTTEAIRELEAAVKLAPDTPEAHLHLATAYSRAGRTQDAAREREIFTKLDKERKD